MTFHRLEVTSSLPRGPSLCEAGPVHGIDDADRSRIRWISDMDFLDTPRTRTC